MGQDNFSIEVIVLPVSDVDRALHFYVDQIGFSLDVDYFPVGTFRVVQLTPPGSGCSIQIGKGLTSVPCVRMGKYWRFRLTSLDHWVATQHNRISRPFRVERGEDLEIPA